jgi:dolichyl-diphosphooligosaccharide--protein glycosyltransferase
LRVIPAWKTVFAPTGVSLQEGDAWFHARTIHNLLAHFPLRSGFDPYLRYPGGGDIPTGPGWDYLVAAAAWIGGAGSPSRQLVDAIAAWLPAILGALTAALVFLLGRRLFGTAAGLFAALWLAVLPGSFLWVTHLGLADHHAAETFWATVFLACFCEALETTRLLPVAGAGLALGAYLATRPNGVFVPGIMAEAVLLVPEAAPVLLRVLAIAAAAAAATAGPAAWLSLAIAAAASLVAMRPWKQRAILGVAAAAVVFAARPYWLAASLWQFRRYLFHLDTAATVQETLPLLRSHGPSAWRSAYYQLGSSWVVAVPAFLWMLAARKRRPAINVFAVWCAVMAAGALVQVRMTVYAAVVAAILAGAGCAWLAGRNRAVAAGLAALIVATNLPVSLEQMRIDAGPTEDWTAALSWLRVNSPEPLGDPAAWLRRYRTGRAFNYPPSAYGIAVQWQYGYWVQSLARRIPSANGTQAGATDMAAFFTGADPAAAMDSLRRLGIRYVVMDFHAPLFGIPGPSNFPAMLAESQRDPRDYYRILMQGAGANRRPLVVYLPQYYRSMAARLYLLDGEAATGRDVLLFETQVEDGWDTVIWRREFATESEAAGFAAGHPERSFLMACIDPGRSCVSLEPLAGVRRVFSSDPLPLSLERPLRAVKIFEVEGR